MEIYELSYFLGVAQSENIHRASERLRISPASLSKAITRLEAELSIKLFQRDGRNIKLTDHGKLLQKRASEIVRMEESARLEIGGHHGAIQAVMAGPEILLSKMGLSLTKKIKGRFPLTTFEFHAIDDENAIEQVIRGEAHIAIVTQDISPHQELSSKLIANVVFETYVGEKHPLYGASRLGKSVSIEEVLKYPFVSPNHPLLGKVGLKRSFDGWRDDQFPRKIEYLTSSLKLLEELVVTGQAIAYLPDYYCKKLPIKILKVTGCPYKCVQKVKLVVRSSKEISWLNQIF